MTAAILERLDEKCQDIVALTTIPLSGAQA